MIRHALHGLLNTGIMLVLLLVVLAVFLQTGPGKKVLATQLSSLLSTPEEGIEITGIHGWIPLDMRIDRLQLADRKGPLAGCRRYRAGLVAGSPLQRTHPDRRASGQARPCRPLAGKHRYERGHRRTSP